MSPTEYPSDGDDDGDVWDEEDETGWDDEQWDDDDYEDYLAREFPDQTDRRGGFSWWQWTAIGLLAVFLLYLVAGLA